VEDHIYKLVELTGTATTNIDDAVRNALAKASKTVRNLRWFQVTEVRGSIADGNVSQWQVTMKVGFTLD
jgi:dodecin